MKCDFDTKWPENYSKPFLQPVLKQRSQPATHYFVSCLEETLFPLTFLII